MPAAVRWSRPSCAAPEFSIAKLFERGSISPVTAKSAFLGRTDDGADITKPSLYDRVGSIYANASMVDDFIDRIMSGEQTFSTYRRQRSVPLFSGNRKTECERKSS